MADKSIIEKLVSNTPLALVVIGAFIFLTGAAGGWPSLGLQVQEVVWQATLAVMGVIVGGIGGLLIWKERNKHTHEVSKMPEKYGLKIVHPDKTQISECGPNLELSGTYQHKPPAESVQVYVVIRNKYWPIMKPGHFYAAQGVWRANVHLGGESGPRTIVLAVAQEVGQALYNYYWKVADEAEQWFSIETPTADIEALAPEIVECDRVNISLKAEDDRRDRASISSTVAEQILYDMSQGHDPFDFKGVEGRRYIGDKPTGPKGLGRLTIEPNGVLNLQRENTEGRFEIHLCRYRYGDSEQTMVPKNELVSGERKLRVSCEAKVIGGEHTLRFVLKNPDNLGGLPYENVRVASNEWTPIDVYFQCTPSVGFFLRIDDQDVSQVPSSVQIRELVVAEKVSW